MSHLKSETALENADYPDSSPERTKSITYDKNGDTFIAKEDGDVIAWDEKAERALIWKFDLRILPMLAAMYLFNSLDKSNLGNAKTAGLEKSLGFPKNGNDYNIILSVFFVPYVLTAPVLGILGKMYGPARVLPCMMFAFGSFTILVVAVHNFGGLMTLRWFLGMSFYRRGELARRLAIFYAASSIASAFGGLLAFGVFQIKTGRLEDWRYLFLIEGCSTVFVSAFAFWYLPKSAAEANFLTADEKRLAFYRMQVDSSSKVQEKFVFRDAIKILKHPTSWMILAIEMCLGVPLQSVSLFLPQIVSRLGYSTVKTNLYTVVRV
ncbi:hypothetical protein LTR66_016010 [Elasticomyces elasticus]|nr:hypothetical protein LTR66_016010 [Elasticomyces elasticus]